MMPRNIHRRFRGTWPRNAHRRFGSPPIGAPVEPDEPEARSSKRKHKAAVEPDED